MKQINMPAHQASDSGKPVTMPTKDVGEDDKSIKIPTPNSTRGQVVPEREKK